MKFDKLINLYLESLAGSQGGGHNDRMKNKTYTMAQKNQFLNYFDVWKTGKDMFRHWPETGLSWEEVEFCMLNFDPLCKELNLEPVWAGGSI
jgi:hypothetical protein